MVMEGRDFSYQWPCSLFNKVSVVSVYSSLALALALAALLVSLNHNLQPVLNCFSQRVLIRCQQK